MNACFRAQRGRAAWWVVLAATLIRSSVGVAMDREAVLRWVTVPAPPFEFEIAWKSTRGFVRNDPYRPDGWEEKDRADRQRELEQRLGGNSRQPELWIALARLHEERGASNEVRRARSEAEKLLRPLLTAEATNALYHIQLAEALGFEDRYAEAERLFLTATRLAPDDPRTWCALADFELRACFRELGPFDTSFVDVQGDLVTLAVQARDWLARTQVSPERITAARARVRRSGEAADRAARVPQPTVEAYMTRWTFHSNLEPMVNAMLGVAPDAAIGSPGGQGVGEYVDDLRRASLLATNEPYALCLGASAMALATVVSVVDPDFEPTRESLSPHFSPAERAYFAEVDRRLDALTRQESKTKASEAALSLGFLRLFIAGNHTNAAVLAERADELDPGNTAALPLAAGAWSSAEQPERAVAVANRWLQRWDHPLSRAFRAKILARAGRLDDAEVDLRWILQRQSTNLMALAGTAAVDLLRPDPERVRRATESLRELEEKAVRPGDDELRKECRLLRAAGLALSGDTSIARRLVYGVLAAEPTSRDCRKLLDAMNAN